MPILLIKKERRQKVRKEKKKNACMKKESAQKEEIHVNCFFNICYYYIVAKVIIQIKEKNSSLS